MDGERDALGDVDGESDAATVPGNDHIALVADPTFI